MYSEQYPDKQDTQHQDLHATTPPPLCLPVENMPNKLSNKQQMHREKLILFSNKRITHPVKSIEGIKLSTVSSILSDNFFAKVY